MNILSKPDMGFINSKFHKKQRKFICLALMGVGFLTFAPASQASLYNFTTISIITGYPATQAHGINDSGQVVGQYYDTSGWHGFVDSDGNINTITYPYILLPVAGTIANGINNNGQVVGRYAATTNDEYSGKYHGFTESGGNFKTIDYPTAITTWANGINSSGQVVGWFYNATGYPGYHSFVEKDGNFTVINTPSAPYSSHAYGINDNGQIVGYYDDINGYHGFEISGGVFTTLDHPSAVGTVNTGTRAYGINNNGQVVGQYWDGTSYHGFVESEGIFTTLDSPFATKNNNITGNFGINNSGQIVGTYVDDNGNHGFVATPATIPIPAAAWLFGSALGAPGFFNRRLIA